MSCIFYGCYQRFIIIAWEGVLLLEMYRVKYIIIHKMTFNSFERHGIITPCVCTKELVKKRIKIQKCRNAIIDFNILIRYVDFVRNMFHHKHVHTP